MGVQTASTAQTHEFTVVPTARVGMRVRVVLVGESVDPNLRGEVVRIEPLTIEETGEVVMEDYPIIRLDDGREFGGLECFWTEDWADG